MLPSVRQARCHGIDAGLKISLNETMFSGKRNAWGALERTTRCFTDGLHDVARRLRGQTSRVRCLHRVARRRQSICLLYYACISGAAQNFPSRLPKWQVVVVHRPLAHPAVRHLLPAVRRPPGEKATAASHSSAFRPEVNQRDPCAALRAHRVGFSLMNRSRPHLRIATIHRRSS